MCCAGVKGGGEKCGRRLAEQEAESAELGGGRLFSALHESCDGANLASWGEKKVRLMAEEDVGTFEKVRTAK